MTVRHQKTDIGKTDITKKTKVRQTVIEKTIENNADEKKGTHVDRQQAEDRKTKRKTHV